MKTEKIVVNFSSEKLQAIKIFAPEKYDGIENLLVEQLEKLYTKTVPASTVKYINAKNNLEEFDEKKA